MDGDDRSEGRRILKSQVALGLGIAVTLFYLLMAANLTPIRFQSGTGIIGVPLATVATFLMALVWMLEEEACQLAPRRPQAQGVAVQCHLIALGSLVYFSVFFALWTILDQLVPGLGWHHFTLIVLFLVWELTIGAYAYSIKRRLAALGGTPLWWWKTLPDDDELEIDPMGFGVRER